MNGKQARMENITEDGKAVIIPMDHGTTVGPIDGLKDMDQTVPTMVAGGATAVLMHKGILRSLSDAPSCGVIMHLSASTKLARDANTKVLVSSVEEAIRLGADAVSVHVNIGGSEAEPDMLRALGAVADVCEKWQMPLLAMMYPRGKNVPETLDPEAVALVARVGAELGADMVKTVYTGQVDTFRQVVGGCPVPMVIAGGPRCESDRQVFEMVRGALNAGACGVSLGRNAFQHGTPTAMVKALRCMVVDDAGVDEALDIAGGKP